MEVDEMGYITEISLEEAVEMINGIFLQGIFARQNGKSIIHHNRIRAWLKVCDVLEENGLLKGDENEQN